MNKYNELKEKIIEAVPDIMDLKFGCRAETKDGILLFQSLFKGTTYEDKY